MKRGGNLQRRTPLRSQSGLTGGKGLKRGEGKRKPPRYTGPGKLTRETVLERDGYACVCCGQSVIGQVYSLQHRKRRSQGGSNCTCNLLVVLGSGSTGHHWRIDSRIDPEDEAKGYTVRSGQDPASVPVMVFEADGSGLSQFATCDGAWSTAAPEGMCAA